jgi:Ca-activated chloride channel family protein
MKQGILFLALLGLSFLLTNEKSYAIGALFARQINSTQTYESITIKTCDATVAIHDQLAVTYVDQRFYNNAAASIEATYIFPLPKGAFITHFAYWFNGQKYTASIKERQSAQRTYDSLVRKIIDPALLVDLGDNVFKLNIAPIHARSEIRFEITYAELLAFTDGSVEYRFLLNTTGLSKTPLDRVSVQVDAITNKAFTSFRSPSHGNTPANAITRLDSNHYTLSFGDEKYLPDGDLLLRFSRTREETDINVLSYVPTATDSLGPDPYYGLWITTPETVGDDRHVTRNVVFCADVSSSMEGERMKGLKEALGIFLDDLDTLDRFNIIAFSTNITEFSPDLVTATPEGIEAARRFVAGLSAVGLTNISGALDRSLDMSYADTTANILIFMTDGYPTWGTIDAKGITDSATVRNTSHTRIFPFGIGNDISHTLLDAIAAGNDGYSTYIPVDDSIVPAVRNYFRKLTLPRIFDIAVTVDDLYTYDRYPTDIPPTYPGSQVVLFGRYSGSGGDRLIHFHGTMYDIGFDRGGIGNFGSIPGGDREVARFWAKQKIDLLIEEIGRYGEVKELVDAIIGLSVRYSILTPYTAFYADPNNPSGVDADERMLPLRLAMEQNSPNPFSDRTHIVYYIPPSGGTHTMLTIHDAMGRLVRTLVEDDLAPGRYETLWDGCDQQGKRLPSGTYLCRLQSDGNETTRSMLLIR